VDAALVAVPTTALRKKLCLAPIHLSRAQGLARLKYRFSSLQRGNTELSLPTSDTNPAY